MGAAHQGRQPQGRLPLPDAHMAPCNQVCRFPANLIALSAPLTRMRFAGATYGCTQPVPEDKSGPSPWTDRSLHEWIDLFRSLKRAHGEWQARTIRAASGSAPSASSTL